MSAMGPFKGSDAIRRLKQEIQELTDQQTEARKMAALVGMTPAEAEQYDDRRSRIAKLHIAVTGLSEIES